MEAEPAEGPKTRRGVGEKTEPPIGWHCHFLRQDKLRKEQVEVKIGREV